MERLIGSELLLADKFLISKQKAGAHRGARVLALPSSEIIMQIS